MVPGPAHTPRKWVENRSLLLNSRLSPFVPAPTHFIFIRALERITASARLERPEDHFNDRID